MNFLIIDEISTVSCQLLGKVNDRLSAISSRKGNTKKPFGGMHVLMCGDFHQLPPVLEAPLYTKEAKQNDVYMATGQAAWKQVEDVVLLTEQIHLNTNTANQLLSRCTCVLSLCACGWRYRG